MPETSFENSEKKHKMVFVIVLQNSLVKLRIFHNNWNRQTAVDVKTELLNMHKFLWLNSLNVSIW